MVITDGSHVVKMPKDTRMVEVTVRYECVATACLFADSVDTVKEFVKNSAEHRVFPKMPLPFGGQDGSQNLLIKKITVDGEEMSKGGD